MMPPGAPRRSAFLSYRRSDTDAVAGRIKDRLASVLPDWDVFMDVASVEGGADFRRAIDATIARSSVVVVLMGKRWAGDDGTRILEDGDLVRHEVRLALSSGIRVIPVVVNDAPMPKACELPDDIAALASRNALELRHSRFDDDFANLVRTMSGARIDSTVQDRRQTPWRNIAVGALLGLAFAVAALVAHLEMTGRAASERLGDAGATLFIPLVVLIGAMIGYFRSKPN